MMDYRMKRLYRFGVRTRARTEKGMRIPRHRDGDGVRTGLVQRCERVGDIIKNRIKIDIIHRKLTQ